MATCDKIQLYWLEKVSTCLGLTIPTTRLSIYKHDGDSRLPVWTLLSVAVVI